MFEIYLIIGVVVGVLAHMFGADNAEEFYDPSILFFGIVFNAFLWPFSIFSLTRLK